MTFTHELDAFRLLQLPHATPRLYFPTHVRRMCVRKISVLLFARFCPGAGGCPVHSSCTERRHHKNSTRYNIDYGILIRRSNGDPTAADVVYYFLVCDVIYGT